MTPGNDITGQQTVLSSGHDQNLSAWRSAFRSLIHESMIGPISQTRCARARIRAFTGSSFVNESESIMISKDPLIPLRSPRRFRKRISPSIHEIQIQKCALFFTISYTITHPPFFGAAFQGFGAADSGLKGSWLWFEFINSTRPRQAELVLIRLVQ